MTWEDHGPGSREVHYRGIFDDKGRLMVIICHNTDLGDGWEREGEDPELLQGVLREEVLPDGHQHRDLRHDPLTGPAVARVRRDVETDRKEPS